MQPNGLLGNILGIVHADVIDPQTKQVILKKGEEVTVSPGKMKHDMRKFYFDNPHEIVSHLIKAKLFPKGMKDKPRFPVYTSHRNLNDL